jgi:F420 biosynthesis protein FbiB-like protein
MPGTAFSDVLATRRSIRRYQAQPLPAALIDALLATAIAAPSPHNRQPWRFVVIEHASTRSRLAGAMGERLRSDRAQDGDPPQAIEADVARSHARITGAPALILLCICMADMDRYPDAARSQREHLMATQSVAMAAQNLLLAAHERGLGACWMCAPLFCPDVVARTLQLPADWEPQGLITLGFPADAGKARPRLSVSEVTRYQDRPT